MKKIVLFSGGTGTLKIQDGLFKLFGSNLDLSIIINAYDNGLSTGAVRTVADGKILGPSDLRKNQLHQFKLLYIKNDTSPEYKFFKFLNQRKNFNNGIECKNYIKKEIEYLKKYNHLGNDNNFRYNTLMESVNSFFNKEKSYLIDYNDFSISNIIYAGLAIKHGNSLEAAGNIMADVLNLPEDRVVLISDKSLYLQAITSQRNVIFDEAKIVSWNNPDDKILGIILKDFNGKKIIPEISQHVKNIILSADIITVGPGTFWSSLAPTFIHKNFKNIINQSKALKYFITNNTEDLDMVGVNTHQLIDVANLYLPLKDFTIVYNSDVQQTKHPYHKALLGNFGKNKTHDSIELVKVIIKSYLENKLNLESLYDSNLSLALDFDGTIFNGKKEFNLLSMEILKKLVKLKIPVSIITGNSIKHINESVNFLMSSNHKNFNNIESSIFDNILFDDLSKITLFADGGNSLCKIENNKFVYDKSVVPFYFMRNEFIYDVVQNILKLNENITLANIENRNNLTISIRWLNKDERVDILKKIRRMLSYEYISLQADLAGRYSIDIKMSGYNKSVALNDASFKNKTIIYVGDELENGNDAVFKNKHNVRTFSVDNPYETYKLISILK